ncbi:MAG TPA: energy transducer TonB [Candidatus Methylacidiphilales bacterium]|nr:energy transducer TonB [Candidatus Methylacidiphilales bacterium]
MATPTPELSAPPSPGAAPSGAVTQTMALLHPWIDYVPKRQRRLGLFIFIALLAHLAIIHFIQIDAIRADLRRQAHIHVMVAAPVPLAAEDAANDRLWDRLTDPRLFILPLPAPAQRPAGESPLDFPVINAGAGSQLMPLPVAADSYRVAQTVIPPVEQSVQTAMIPPRQPFSYEEASPPIAAETTWQWDDALDQRKPLNVPVLPSPVSNTDLAPTQLRIAVNPGGTVEHVLLEQSCGSDRIDLDQQAILAARKVRFKSTGQPGLIWGRVTIFWHYAPEPPEVVVPTPPSST